MSKPVWWPANVTYPFNPLNAEYRGIQNAAKLFADKAAIANAEKAYKAAKKVEEAKVAYGGRIPTIPVVPGMPINPLTTRPAPNMPQPIPSPVFVPPYVPPAAPVAMPTAPIDLPVLTLDNEGNVASADVEAERGEGASASGILIALGLVGLVLLGGKSVWNR